VLVGLSHSVDTSRERTEFLSKLSCSVRGGEALAIIGPSHSGSFRLLPMDAGLEKPAGGSMCFPIAGAQVIRARSVAHARRGHTASETDSHGARPHPRSTP
jgi:predicted ABC-type transport system involved in lysophospholipase L1 biosynthesis ATPase subunit